nr:hypothetical protein [Tanacetum cinerariifolium]
MPSLFADTHNVVAILEKSDASEGFAQIIDFLSVSYINYALTVSPHIYISCIKQFWNTAVVKRTGEVTSSSKFYMYPRFIQLIIQAQVVDLSSHTTRYISLALTQKVFANMRRVGKGCSGIETPLFENMLEIRKEDAEEEVQVSAHDHVDQENVIEEIADDVAQPTSPLPPSLIQVLAKCSTLVLRVEGLESANTAQQLEILKLKARVKKLERLNKVKSSKLRRLKKVGTSQRIESSKDEENVFNQGRINVDIDEGIELVDYQENDVQEDSEVQEVVEVVNAAKLMTEVATTAASIPIPDVEPVVAAVSTPISVAKPKVLKVVHATLTVSTRKRKGVVIRDPEEELHDDTPAETQSVKDKGKEEEEIIKSINETPAQKAAKRRRQREQAKEAKDLKKQLEVVADEDDDVFVEATPIGTKVPVVNYNVVMINNKPRYKIFRADDTHQLYTSFITLLKNFDREDLEDLWKIVKAKFSTSKPTNFTDDYLLATLDNMFEKTYAQDVLRRSQQTEHGQALVKSWKLLTLCVVNVARLQIVMANPNLENLNVPNEGILEEDPHHLLDYDEEEYPKMDIEEEEPEEEPVEKPEPLPGHGYQFDAHPNPQPGNMNGWVDDDDDIEEEDEENKDADIEEDDDAEIIFPYEVQGDQTPPPRDESSDSDSEPEAEEADDEPEAEEAEDELEVEEAGVDT